MVQVGGVVYVMVKINSCGGTHLTTEHRAAASNSTECCVVSSYTLKGSLLFVNTFEPYFLPKVRYVSFILKAIGTSMALPFARLGVQAWMGARDTFRTFK